MKKDKLRQKEHGIISVVQSPEVEENQPESTEEAENTKEHGIISIVQSPDREPTTKTNQ